MSRIRYVTVMCDAAGCGEESAPGHTAAAVIGIARRDGWRAGRSGGPDLCPLHHDEGWRSGTPPEEET